MKNLSIERMEQIEGGQDAECAYAIALGVAGVFGIFIAPLGAAVLVAGLVRPPQSTCD